MTIVHRDITAEEIGGMVCANPFIIEVGCNDGRDTKLFLEAMPAAQIVCFDPEPRAISHFLCTDDPRVDLFEVGIWHKHETRRFRRSGGIPDCTDATEPWFQSGSFHKPKEHLAVSPEITFPETISVQCRPLDYYQEVFQLPVDFLWCDAQGSEPSVILGGQRTFSRTRYAYFEFYEKEIYERGANLRGLRSFLPDYDLIGTYGDNALFKNRNFNEQP